MAEFKLGRIKFVWKNDWATGTTYYKDDIVAYGGKTYLCVVGHTAAADFYTDVDNVPTKWNQFSDGQDWKGNWSATTLYKENDIVKYGGYVYICNNGHTSDTTLEANQANWDLFAESLDWKGDWVATTVYKVNDLVKYGGYVYICNAAHTAAASDALGLEDDQSSWDLFSKGTDWKGAWTTSTRYKVGDLVKFGGTTYVCNLHHTSASTESLGLEVDQAKWDYFNSGIEYKGNWLSGTRYKINDVVKNGGGTWICTGIHIGSSNFTSDVAFWAQFVEGIEFEGTWVTSTTYQPGDIVSYGGNSYIAKTAHISSSAPSIDAVNYDLFSTGFKFQDNWDSGVTYKVGEVVRNNGYTYVAIADGLNQKPPNAGYWELLNQGMEWQGTWTNSAVYVLGDTVKYLANSYICVQAHTASSGTNRPDIDTLGEFWNLLTAGNEESALTTVGDLVYYSGAGPTRLPIGDEGQVLTVENGLPTWQYFGQVEKVFYVGPNGTDIPAPTYGLTVDKPFATVRYALEQVEKGYENQNSAYLMNINRTFIQKEIVEWTDYQIANNIAPFTSGFTYDKTTCQRDMGLLVDAIVWDLTHTGNSRSIEAAQAYFTALGVSYITGQEDETIASINYGVELINNILSNSAPTANYQTLNGISAGDRIKQIIDTDYVAEAAVPARVTELVSIVTDAITAGDTDSLPVTDTPGYTINVKTGQYYEVLPMIVPANTAIVGDELRSTRISPAGKLIPTNDKAKSIATLQRLKSITTDVVTNVTVTPTTGNIVSQNTTGQKAGNVGSTTAVSRIESNILEIKDILANGLGSVDAFTFGTPTNWGSSLTDTAYASTGNATGATSTYDNARAQVLANTAFIKSEITAWIAVQVAGNISPFTDSFTYDSAACARDVGYILDAMRYDLTYGGNTQTMIAAAAYYSFGSATFGEGEKEETLAAYARLKTVVGQVITEASVSVSAGNAETQDVSGTAGNTSSKNFGEERIQNIIDVITNDGDDTAIGYPATVTPATSWVSTELLTARNAINTLKSTIQTDGVTYIKREYPALNFNEATCSRDVGYIVDALGYDLMFNSNFASIKAGMAYRRGTSSALLVVADQLAATQSILDFVGHKSKLVAASGSAVVAGELWDYIIDYVDTGVRPLITGTNAPVTDLDIINGSKILQLNKEFMVAEADAFIADTYKATVSDTTVTTNVITCASQTWLSAGDTVRFTGTVFGGISTGTTYYVISDSLTSTTFKVSLTLGGPAVDLSTASGTMTVVWYYNSASCQNDVRNYIDAISKDIVYTGNYNSVLASRYYRSAFTGSKLEDMFYVRNGCGLRNCTLTGLDGTSDGNTAGAGEPTGLTVANVNGTKRPLAGAYVSLNPGWGPNDYRAWVTNKSTYVQNVTTFGTACVGQKIDGSLHAGGVDSIVSNDFTQVLSDGIGAWVANLGRAELVSVFTYYNYIGYLAENGGKIRATNGNNSYGVYGSVSEGIDVTEVPVIGNISNRNAEADVRSTITNGTSVLLLEYGNAGSEYSEATYTISGSGANAAARGDEFRDESIFQLRLTDPGDSTGPGGTNYITASNQAQDGNTTSITLAAADTNASSVYVGMAIYLVAGTGAGQFGYITSYNAGSKLAQISKPSTGTAGWDHVVAGTPIVSAIDVTTTYEISPRIEIAAPGYTKSLASLPSSSNWTDVVFGNAYASYNDVSSSTSGSGTLAKFDVVRRHGVYTVTVSIPGVTYTVGDTLTILGSLVGGTDVTNDITITVTGVTGGSSGVSEFTYTGSAVSAKYVAIASGTTSAAYSVDGLTWSAMTMPSAVAAPGATSNQWSAITYVVYNNVGRYVAVAKESATAAYSIDGLTWSVAALGDYADWKDVTGSGTTLVAVAESDSGTNTLRSVSTDGGANWTLGTLPIGVRAIAYGATRFVAIEGSFSNSAAYSTNGVTWTTVTMPANDDSTESNWVDVAYGNGRYVAVADSAAMAAYSLDGATWYKSDLPGIYEWTSVRYGQGVFYATTRGEVSASSPDGVTWTLRDSTVASLTVTASARDITSASYTARTLPDAADWTDVIWTGTKFLAVGNDATGANTNAFAASSTDGETWATVVMPESAGVEVRSVAYNGVDKYVSFIYNDRDLYASADGVTWSVQNTNGVNNLPVARNWVDSAYGNGKFVVIGSTGTNPVVYSTDGTTWISGTLANQPWSSVAQGTINGTHYFVAVSTLQQAAYSTDGVTWTAGNTLPSSDAWNTIAYGNGRFVTVAGDFATATTKAAYSTNGTTWTAATMPGAAATWNSVTYGGGAFTAFANGGTRTAYSTDGVTWVEGPTLSSVSAWKTSAYGNSRNVVLADGITTNAASLNFVLDTNLFTTTTGTTNLAVNDRIRFSGTVFGGVDANTVYYVSSIFDATQFTISAAINGTNFTVTTESGSMTGTTSKNFEVSGFGNYLGTPRWVALGAYNSKAQVIRQGAQARARAYVVDEQISEIWMHEPGSGYTSTPTITITDPNNIGADATIQVRIGNGVLGQPTWTNRGTSYTASTATITGNGYSDNYQVGSYVGFTNLTGIPKAGSNVQIAGIDDVWYRLVNVTNLIPTAGGTYSATLQLSPQIGVAEAPEHATGVIIRRRYSQVRLTGHDFLDIGTGNYTDSNYPGLPINDPIAANETVVNGGGRVFWTSTDQDGNFRVGGLFNVEQSTGVATLNADAFNIAGLNELSLGSVALGGSGATITEFSTDPFFTQDSDTVIPTQRAIKAYITSQIGGGGSSLNVNTLTAGVIYVAGQTITTTTNQQININTKVNFKGGIVGDALVLNYFLLNK